MTAERALEILDRLAQAGVDARVDGGWGVDALLGRQTRPHDDLDLVVGLDATETIQRALAAEGFALLEDERPVRFVLRGPGGEQVDFHTVRWDAEGGGLQPQPSGGHFRYPPEGFVEGRIANRPVRCISAAIQLLCHLGYAPGAKDRADVEALCARFGLEPPAPYRDEPSPS